jgi:membrane associated rhomboid family serine protease
MILPIGHEPEGTKRPPWVTFALLAALVAGFLVSRGELGFMGGSEVKLDSALEVWLSHPYLEPDPALLAEAAKGTAREDFAERVAAARAEAETASVHPDTRVEQQAELDYVTRLALRGTDSNPGPTHPFRHFGWLPSAPAVTGFLAHPFLHAGWAHLALTLLLIWLAGPALEGAFGRALFGALCLASAGAGAGAYALAAPTSSAPLVGAWAIASGLVAAFTLRFAGSEVRFGAEALVAPGWLALLPWLVAGALLRFTLASPAVETGESLAPSLAALGCGAALALAAKLSRWEERRAIREREAREAVQLDPRIRRARDAHARGSHDQAISLATSVLRERPDDPDALLAIWHSQLGAGREAQGVTAAKRLIEVCARHGNLALAARVFDELVRALPATRLETTVLLRIVPELVVQARRDSALAALRCVIAPENRSLSVGQAVRAAELAAELDPRCALNAARFALERSAELADDKRERLTKLARELEAKLGGAPAGGEAPIPAAPAPSDPPERDAFSQDFLGSDSDSSDSFGELPPPPATTPERPAAEPFELEPTNLAETAATVVYAEAAPSGVPPTIPAAPPRPPRTEPSVVKLTAAVPVELDPAGLRLRIEGGAPSLLAWERIQAVGVGLVAGIAPKPIVVIDLALNWADGGDGVLEVLRMRSDSFRARALVGGEGSALEALRALLAQLLARSGGVPLPDGGSAHGLPFREFPDPSSYERDVLLQAS